MKLKLILFIYLIAFTSNIFSQNPEIEGVGFSYSHSIKLRGQGSKVEISIYRKSDDPKLATVVATVDGKDVNKEISIEKFIEIRDIITKISSKDILVHRDSFRWRQFRNFNQ